MWYLRHLVELKRIMLRNSFTVSSYSSMGYSNYVKLKRNMRSSWRDFQWIQRAFFLLKEVQNCSMFFVTEYGFFLGLGGDCNGLSKYRIILWSLSSCNNYHDPYSWKKNKNKTIHAIWLKKCVHIDNKMCFAPKKQTSPASTAPFYDPRAYKHSQFPPIEGLL